MTFFSRFAPVRAWRDFRNFLLSRQKYELAFLFVALLGTSAIIGLFLADSPPEVRPERQIIYVQSWPLNRTDAEIKAQQKIDSVEKAKQMDELQKLQKARQEQFKRVDDALRKWGI